MSTKKHQMRPNLEENILLSFSFYGKRIRVQDSGNKPKEVRKESTKDIIKF